MHKRKTHSGEYKARIVLEVFRGEMTVAKLAAINELHPSLIHKWVKEAKAGLPGVFSATRRGRPCTSKPSVKRNNSLARRGMREHVEAGI